MTENRIIKTIIVNLYLKLLIYSITKNKMGSFAINFTQSQVKVILHSLLEYKINNVYLKCPKITIGISSRHQQNISLILYSFVLKTLVHSQC